MTYNNKPTKNRKQNKFGNKPSVKTAMSEAQTHAYKKFGQNFLLDRKYIDFMIDGLEFDTQNDTQRDFVIEIGPGMGALTTEITNDELRMKNYLGIELDVEKVLYLKREMPQIRLENISILDFDVDKFCTENNIENYKLIGSLPFNISKKIIQKFSECKHRPDKAVLMVQKEVGNNYAVDVENGSSFLSIYLSQFWNVVDKMVIPAAAFYPMPKVDGMVLVLDPVQTANYKLIKFVRMGFGSPRKKLGNVLQLDKNNHYYNKRAHELTIQDWKNLFDQTTHIG